MNRHFSKKFQKVQSYFKNVKLDLDSYQFQQLDFLGIKSKIDLESLRQGLLSLGIFIGKSSSPIFAQRICRTYQVLQLHSRLWSGAALSGTSAAGGTLPSAAGKSSSFIVNKLNSKQWFLSFIIFSLCEQRNYTTRKKQLGRLQGGEEAKELQIIKESELFAHMGDLDFIHELTASTVICPECNDRLIVDRKLKNVQYCRCSQGKFALDVDLEGNKWAPYVETPDLLIWRQPHETNEGLYKYKVYGYYNDITPTDFLATQLDLTYRKKWDSHVLNLEIVEQNVKSGIDIVHWEMEWPKLFANRDYCFARRHIVNEKEGTIVIMNKAIAHHRVPEKNGTVRVKEYYSVMQIKAVKGLNEPGVEFGLTYYDNPGLALPAWLLNWAAMTAIPDFLNQVRNAARIRRKAELTKKSNNIKAGLIPGKNAQESSNPTQVSTSSSSGSSSSSSQPRNSEILSQFFKENILQATLTEEA